MWPNDPGLEYFSESLATDNLIYPGACVLSRFSRVQFFVTLWTIASVHGILQAKYWSGLPCPPPEDLSDPGIESGSLNVSCTGRWVPYH